ncbi:MAG: M15 family metallopeptidase [Elusimicrobiota bacterium]
MPLLLLLIALTCACVPKTWLPPIRDPELVDLREVDPRIAVDIRYATPNNFTGQVLYPANRCLLQKPVAMSLSRIASELAKERVRLKVWDCYRPLSVQRKLWSILPNPRYVADPAVGSKHNRGASVDATLTDLNGRELLMPSAYDDFSERANRDYTDAPAEALRNRKRLEDAMAREGFKGLATEWWHFDAAPWQEYPLMDLPLESGQKAEPPAAPIQQPPAKQDAAPPPQYEIQPSSVPAAAPPALPAGTTEQAPAAPANAP